MESTAARVVEEGEAGGETKEAHCCGCESIDLSLVFLSLVSLALVSLALVSLALPLALFLALFLAVVLVLNIHGCASLLALLIFSSRRTRVR